MTKNHSKRYFLLKNLIQNNEYSLQEGINLLKKFAELNKVSFLESVEAHFALNVKLGRTDQHVKGEVTLPYGTGKKINIGIFADKIDFINIDQTEIICFESEEIFQKIKENKINLDILLTTPAKMAQLTKFARVLGPKGLMPSHKSGTIVTNLIQTIDEFKKGKIKYRMDKNGVIHSIIGTTDFTSEQLINNLQELFNSIEKNKPIGLKGKYFKTIALCLTMSPSINITISSFK